MQHSYDIGMGSAPSTRNLTKIYTMDDKCSGITKVQPLSAYLRSSFPRLSAHSLRPFIRNAFPHLPSDYRTKRRFGDNAYLVNHFNQFNGAAYLESFAQMVRDMKLSKQS